MERKIFLDQLLSPEYSKEWQSLLSELERGFAFSMPRQVIYSEEVDLHLFSDTSAAAYSTVAYAVSSLNGTPVSHLLLAKSKVSPIKELTIPRLELMGALLSSRLCKFIESAFQGLLIIKTITCWCDNQITLQWLHSTKQLLIFIQNRVD